MKVCHKGASSSGRRCATRMMVKANNNDSKVAKVAGVAGVAVTAGTTLAAQVRRREPTHTDRDEEGWGWGGGVSSGREKEIHDPPCRDTARLLLLLVLGTNSSAARTFVLHPPPTTPREHSDVRPDHHHARTSRLTLAFTIFPFSTSSCFSGRPRRQRGVPGRRHLQPRGRTGLWRGLHLAHRGNPPPGWAPSSTSSQSEMRSPTPTGVRVREAEEEKKPPTVRPCN